ncbi:MAG: alanine racemase [Eubacteriales bacterium]|nr:alanine racemase [Eubacteriales bacterium]
MRKYTRVYADINLDAVRSNVKELMNNTRAGTKAIAVVKADGYGHGDIAVAKAVYGLVEGFAVATLDEAVNLRKNNILKPVLVLGYVNMEGYKTLIENEIDAAVFDYETACELNEAAGQLGKTAFCHIKVDTGMRRIGLEPDESGIETVKKIKQLPYLKMRGIFTHFAAADEKDKTSALKQLEKYNEFVEALERAQITFEIRHCSNSAAVIDMPQANEDAVRLGIALYGMYPSDEVDFQAVRLTPALELKSTVAMVKRVPAGEHVSYGGTYVTSAPTMLATVETGYGDGYPRALSNKGYVLIHGKKAPICGRVCMDQFMVDVTDIPDVKRGDAVTLVGRDGEASISVEEIASLAGTFNYEFVCDLGKRIPRNYFLGGEYIGSRDYFYEKWDLARI